MKRFWIRWWINAPEGIAAAQGMAIGSLIALAVAAALEKLL
jgi:hypothetical protein